MSPHLSRRSFQLGVGAAALAGLVPRRAAAALKAEVAEIKTISHEPSLYNGWPTVARRANGELVLVCSGGREEHVCPFGRLDFLKSTDEGATWSYPRVILDGDIDDRDAGIVETKEGTLLATTFTSLAYEPILAQAESGNAWPAERLERWRAVQRRTTPEERKKQLGAWMIRSTDGGRSWSPRYDCVVDSPHGPIQLADGRVLYAGRRMYRDEKIGVCESTDDGQSWKWLAGIEAREGDKPDGYHELHAVETDDGRLIVQIRNHNQKNNLETLQCESSDGGKTWSKPQAIGVWGLPSHLLKLKDGRLVMTYGHRRAPLGNQARVSDDHGRTWSEAMILSDDGVTGDLGYPSTVELSDGALLSVWYEVRPGNPRAVLRQARWKLA
jgi:sialidase-1